MSDDLDYNLFWQQLQHQHGALYDVAQTNCYVICVPCTAVWAGLPLTVAVPKPIIESHILKPSPYFHGTFHSSARGKEHIEISIEDGHVVVQSPAGLDGKAALTAANVKFTAAQSVEPFKAKIMSEELFYNAQYKQFRVLVLQDTLSPVEVAAFRQQNGLGSSASSADKSKRMSRVHEFINSGGARDPLIVRKTPAAHAEFLEAFPENASAIASATNAIQAFNRGYVLVKGYLEHASRKVEMLCEQFYADLLDGNQLFSSSRDDSKVQDAIRLAAESFILDGIHTKLFSALCAIDEEADLQLHHRLAALGPLLRPDHLGIKPQFMCDLPDALKELSRLDTLRTPTEKLWCLKDTTQKIANGVAEHFAAKGRSASEAVVTADELIPLLARAIAFSAPMHWQANVEYIQHFQFTGASVPDLNFAMVSCLAAHSFLQSPPLLKMTAGLKATSPEMPRLSRGASVTAVRDVSELWSNSEPAGSGSPASGRRADLAGSSARGPGRSLSSLSRANSTHPAVALPEDALSDLLGSSSISSSSSSSSNYSSSSNSGSSSYRTYASPNAGVAALQRRSTLPTIRPPDVISTPPIARPSPSLSMRRPATNVLQSSPGDGGPDLGDFLSDTSVSSSYSSLGR
ncbi:hypothetical protein CAOG_07170 [Capsaspora owczarzaki ATCC 30864]|uniref:VPS9 domain-containing protein n=1 Tax=Capsaspora owczarzaki (strain ATCC 30864) TaxID=595528 RepID=A0A0D2WWK8_CAPO3|nr:hypothetical protein CAOG_07170 [Capsaspora owczarzaki ATCC 30864]KJE96923.1 hypothetical protein CAOG_007170 [Capsaspora owczarzaki ATCC 30864]|eukprot:XP_004343894.2 hypothetical protein CAOG_07170 [Capsaspora owczarzaki ATCC 30864]